MELLALCKPIKKPPRSDERDGELLCGTEVQYLGRVYQNGTLDIHNTLSNYAQLTRNNFFAILDGGNFQTAGGVVNISVGGISAYNSTTGVITLSGRSNTSSGNMNLYQKVYYTSEPLPS